MYFLETHATGLTGHASSKASLLMVVCRRNEHIPIILLDALPTFLRTTFSRVAFKEKKLSWYMLIEVSNSSSLLWQFSRQVQFSQSLVGFSFLLYSAQAWHLFRVRRPCISA